MPTLLFSLRGVPEDEAYEIKELLDRHEINYYETSAGNWGISLPALWLTSIDELDKAQKLLSKYHLERASVQRENYEQLKKEHKNKRLLDTVIDKPVKFLIYLAAIAFILYLYARMLFEFGL